MQRRALDQRQLALAQRLQRQGLLLREIAEQIGMSFEAVCLGLSTATTESTVTATPAGRRIRLHCPRAATP